MPASEASLAITDSYRASLLDLRLRVTRQSLVLWRALDPANLEETYAEWLSTMAVVLRAAKHRGVTLTDAYLAAFIASETGRPPEAQGAEQDAYDATSDGRTVERALVPPLLTFKRALGDGRADASSLALIRATRIVSDEAMDAPRRALGDLMSQSSLVVGWRRVTSALPCGACLAAADGAVHDPSAPFRRHSHCRCSREPVVDGVRETVRRPTGEEAFNRMSAEEQAALFAGRGGEEKADLIRSGAVPLHALIQREDQAVMPDQFTEAPLAALRGLANQAA